MKKGVSSYTVIGGADGPTSIFIAGRTKERWNIRNLKHILRNKKYQRNRKKIMAQMTADSHSLNEVIEYITSKYEATELPKDSRRYLEQRKDCKSSFILRFQPELIGGFSEIEKPDFENEASVREYFAKIKERQEKAAAIPDEIFPIDFHMYEIKCPGGGNIMLELETIHEHIGFSISAEKGKMKQANKIGKDIYRYYGVSSEDIENQTERYKSVVAVLAD